MAVPSPWFAVARVGWTANESRSRSPKPEKMIRTLPTSECRKYSPTGVATWQDAGCELHDWDCLRLWAAGTCAVGKLVRFLPVSLSAPPLSATFRRGAYLCVGCGAASLIYRAGHASRSSIFSLSCFFSFPLPPHPFCLYLPLPPSSSCIPKFVLILSFFGTIPLSFSLSPPLHLSPPLSLSALALFPSVSLSPPFPLPLSRSFPPL